MTLFMSCTTPMGSSSGTRVPTANDSVTEKRNHFVITIHGVGGTNSTQPGKDRTKSTFGYLDLLLKQHLTKIQPQEETQVLSFEYPTGNLTKSTFDFAYNNLSSFLDSELPKRGFKRGDRITFIAHSQGGLVAAIWYTGVKLLVNQDGDPAPELEKYQIYSQATDRIITIGTPFWGSKLATAAMYKDGIDIESQSLLAKLLDLGIRELKEMSFLSNTIYKFRRTAIALSSKEEFQEKFKDAPELINIGGVFPEDNEKLFYHPDLVPEDKGLKIANIAVKFLNEKLKKHAFASEIANSDKVLRSESDIAVTIPSGRSQFLYANHQVTCQKSVLLDSQFEIARIFPKSKYILTESIHAPLMAPRSVGMVFVPEFCMDPKKCVHPTYRYVLRYAAACDRSNSETCNKDEEYKHIDEMFKTNKEDSRRSVELSDAKDLQGFSLEVSIKVPMDYELPVTMLKFRPFPDQPDSGEWYLNQNFDSFSKILKIDQPRLTETKYNRQQSLVEIKSPRKKEFFAYSIDEKEIQFRGERSKYIRLHLTGIIKPKIDYAKKESEMSPDEKATSYREYIKLLEEGISLPLRIRLPESKTLDRKNDNAEVLVEAKLRPGYSTFVDLDYRDAIDCSQR